MSDDEVETELTAIMDTTGDRGGCSTPRTIERHAMPVRVVIWNGISFRGAGCRLQIAAQ